MKCRECGSATTGGVCRECGMVEDSYRDYDFGDSYPYDKDNEGFSYGGARTHAISDISVMTKVNKAECNNPSLRRALRWDGNYNWHVQKTEIVNEEIRQVCRNLGLGTDFLNNCYLLFKRIRVMMKFTGKKLEHLATAIVYLRIRLDSLPYNLLDFRRCGYNIDKLWKIYKDLIKRLDLYNFVKPQNPEWFAMRFINELASGKDVQYKDIRELTILVIDLFKWFVNTFNKGEIDGTANIGMGGLGACLYLYCKNDEKLNCTQSDIAEICGISEVTIRDYIDKIKTFFDKNENSNR